MLTEVFTFLIGVSSLVQANLITSCPPLESLPCRCDAEPYPDISCNRIEDLQKLQKTFQQMQGYRVKHLELFNVNVTAMPADLFKGLHIEELRLVHFKVMNDTPQNEDKSILFQGLENSLLELMIEGNSKFYPHIKSLKFDHMKVLSKIVLQNFFIGDVENNWFSKGPKSLKSLTISNIGMSKLGDKAFQSLEGLTSINLRSNRISKLSRSMLPRQAYSLRTLDFSHNQIWGVPSDFFNGLPSLSNIDISFNYFEKLQQNPWSSVLPQLKYLNMNGNIFVCDENLKWVCKSRMEIMRGKCSSPLDYRGLTFSQFCKFSS